MLLDQAADAILVQDMQGRIEYWNNSATKLHGWEAIEVLGRCADDFLYEDANSIKEVWGILLRSGAWQGELKKLAKDGRILTFQSVGLSSETQRTIQSQFSLTIKMSRREKSLKSKCCGFNVWKVSGL